MTDSVKEMTGIGPEDIERNGYDGQYVRSPKSPGWVRLEGGWFEIKRPADADGFMMGPVSNRAAPLRQASRERWDASMAAATARGKLIQMQRVAERYRVPFSAAGDTPRNATAEESKRWQAAFEAEREALLESIKRTLKRRTRNARLILLAVLVTLAAAGWTATAVLDANQNTPPSPQENAA